MTIAPAPGEADLWDAIDASLPGRVVNGMSSALSNAVPRSRCAARWASIHQRWSALSPVHRMRATGATTLVAAAVHLLLASGRQPIGFWWLIVPAIAAVFAVAALVLSLFGPPSERARA